MSLANKAAAGFLWTTAANLVSRFITIISTFILTRFLAPELQGEVNLAAVLVASVGAATTLGVGQYITAHPEEGRDTAFHGTVLLLVSGAVGVAIPVIAANYVAHWLNVPGMAAYVPGLAVAQLLDRLGWMPRSILLRDLRFRVFGIRFALGELTFATTSVLLASLGWGGNAIVAGGIARSTVSLLFVLLVTNFRDYLTPCRLLFATMVRMLKFGVPMTVAGFFAYAATNWDNSFMGWRFGPATVGVYNQAYRLADLPTSSIGDQINDVLVPTFARLDDPKARVRGFFRAASLLAILVFPLGMGLAVIAPTLVSVFYPPSYAGVAPFLIVLASLNAARAIGNLALAMLQVVNRTQIFAVLNLLLVVLVLGSMALLAPLGAVACSAGVGLAFTLSVGLTVRSLAPEGISVIGTVRAVFRPFLACLPMVAAVFVVQRALGETGLPGVARFLIELAVGVASYVAAAFLLAGPVARDFVELGMATVRRRRAKNDAAPASG